MFLSRLRRKSQIRRRKGERETLTEDATRFKDILVRKTQDLGVSVPIKLLRELERASEQRDGGQRLYKLNLRRSHLTDAHIIALTEALEELPVIRKLDLRGNEAMGIQTLTSLNSLLKGQVEAFRLVQADASLADSSLSFLYSVKLDENILAMDRGEAEELAARSAALEVADAVLDVRYSFLQADVREAGTLTEYELSSAMRSVMGAAPKAGETSRVLRFFGEKGAEGKNPTVINLGGFEAAMVGRLRDAHTLPTLPQGCDDLLFRSTEEDQGGEETPDCFSPWSTRSFGATTGGVSGGGGGGGGISKGFSFSASQGLLGSSAGTRVFSLPPWRRGESGTELSRTAKDQGGCGGDKRTPDGFGAVYGDDDDDDDGDGDGERRTPEVDRSQRGDRGGSGRYNNQRGNDESGRGGGARAVASPATNNAETLGTPDSRSAAAAAKAPISSRLVENKKPPSRSGTSSLWPGAERAVGDGGGGDAEDACLTDGSSDDGDGGSSYSQQTQNRDGLSLNSSSRPRNEDQTLAREETGAFASTDAAAASAGGPGRHSSWSAGTRDGSVKGGGRDEGCGLSEHGRRTSRSEAGESQRIDGGPPLVDPENGGVHRLDRSRRGKSAVEACRTSGPLGADGSSERGELLRTLKRLVSGGAWSDKPDMDDQEAVDQETVESQRLSDSQVVSPTASAQRVAGGAAVKSPLVSPRVQRTEARTGRPHGGSPYGGSQHGGSRHSSSHAVATSAEPHTGAADAASSPSSRVGGYVGGKRPSRTASSLSEESVYPSPELFLSRIGTPTAASRAQVGGDLERSTAGTATGGDQEGKHGGVARGASKERESTEAVVQSSTLDGVMSAATPTGSERTAASMITAGVAETVVGATTAVTKKSQGSEVAGHCQLADTMPPSVRQRPRPLAADISSDKAYPPVSMYPEVPSANRTPDAMSAAGSQRKPGVKAGGAMPADGASDVSESSQPGTAAQAALAAQENTKRASVTENRDVVANSAAASAATLTAKPSPSGEAITELSGGSSSDTIAGAQQRGVNVATSSSPVERSTIIREPFCLSPASVAAQASGPHRRAAASSCEERERLAARIQLSAGNSNIIDAETGVKAPRGDARLPLSSPNSGTRRGGVNADVLGGNGSSFVSGRATLNGGGGDGGGEGFRTSAGSPDSDSARFRRAMSPERGWLAGGEGFSSVSADLGGTSYENEGGGVGGGGVGHGNGSGGATHVPLLPGDPVGNRSGQRSSSPVRFHLPSSVTKTAPLCSAGGSTLLHEGELHNAGASGGGGGAWCFLNASDGGTHGRQEEAKGAAGDGTKAVKDQCRSPAGFLQPDEEQPLTVRLNEGALIMSRNGLAKMGKVLELEAMYGCGRDALIGLHTLVLSCNQLKVLDTSVLTTMPALRHLDVSHNVLCRMEPMDGRDLPPRLETLNMSHNRISRIGGIGHCFALRVVNLRHNRIKRVQGLEHLSLLEQLDLGHNAIAKAASARCLSFNRSLKLLWLEGNPLAGHPRYRPTLTCLLPHVRAIDRRGMPPSSDSERRCAGGLSEEGGFGFDGVDGAAAAAAAAVGAGGAGAGRKMGVGVSREWQAEQDERRSKEWRQVMEWREEQARREEEAQEKMSQEKQDARHAVNATQQRRQAEELARPRPRTRASKNMINRAKAVACHRPAVVFGTSYRRGEDKHASLSSTKTAVTEAASTTAAAKRPQPGAFIAEEDRLLLFGVRDEDARDREDKTARSSSPTGWLRSDGSGGREGMVGGPHGGGRGAGEIVRFADISHADIAEGRRSYGLPSATSMVGSTAATSAAAVAAATSTEGNAHVGRVPLASDFRFPPGATDVLLSQQAPCGSSPPEPPPPPLLTAVASSTRSPQWSTVSETRNAGSTSAFLAGAYRTGRPEEGLVVGSGRGGDNARTELTVPSRGGGGGDYVESEGPTEGLVERWLRDVRLETDTAGTALKVLLKMCQERGRRSHADELRRLTNFRAALEDMGLFSRQYGPTPAFVDDEGGALTRKVMVAARGVAMTKAAVKNMLRLMEDVDPGGDDGGAAELDQYARFILQQREITVAGREGYDTNNHDDGGDNSSSFNKRSDDKSSLTTRNNDSSLTARNNDNSLTARNGDNSIVITRNNDNDDDSSCNTRRVPGGAAVTTSEAGPNHAPPLAGACSVSVYGVGVSLQSTAIAAVATTGGPNATAVNLAKVPGNDPPEKLPSTLRQPAGDWVAGGTNFVSHSGREGENVGECHPHCVEMGNKNGTGGDFGGVNASGAVGREGDNSSGSARGSDASVIPGGVEEAVVADQTGQQQQQQQQHGSAQNSLSMLSAATKEGSLVGTVARSPMVAGKGGNSVGEALDTSFSQEVKVGSREAGAFTAEVVRTLDAEGSRNTASVLDVAGKDDVGDDSAGRIQLPGDDAAGGLSFDAEVSRSIVSNVVLSLTSAATAPVIVPASIVAAAAVATTVVDSANIVTIAPPPRESEGTRTAVTVDQSPSSETRSVGLVKVVPERVSVEVDPTEVEGGTRHDHDNQGALVVTGSGESNAAPPSANASSPPTVASVSGIISPPTPTEDSQRAISPDNPSAPSTGDRIGTAASTEVVAVPATSVSVSSPSVVAATHLSARERLLRHVRTAASSSASGSDSSSCSSDTDNDDGRETILRGEHTDTAQIDDGLICEGRASGDVNDDGVGEVHPSGGGGSVNDAVEKEADKSEAGVDAVESTICRPRTTRPSRRQREGADDDSDEHDEPGDSRKSDERVVASFATSVSPSNPAVEVATSDGATGNGDPIFTLGDASTTAVEQTPHVVATKDSAAVDGADATPADTLSIHRVVKPGQQDAVAELAAEAAANRGGDEEIKLVGGDEKHYNSVRMAPSDDSSAATEDCGALPGIYTGRQERGAGEPPVPPLVAAAKASSAAEISFDCERDRHPATGAAGADIVTQDDGGVSVGSLLESSTAEPIRLNIDKSPEKTQGILQGSESSLSVVAPILAQPEPEAEGNRRGSDALEVAAKPLAVEPPRAGGSSRSQHLGEDGDGTVLGEFKEETREVDDGDNTVSEELKEETREIHEAGEGKTQGCGDGGGAHTTEKTAEDTAELAWIEGYDPGHDCYYYHHVPTGESRWYKPDEPYEPYVHSDEEEEDGKSSTLDEGGQGKNAQVVVHEDRRDEGKPQKEDEKKSSSSRKSTREGGSGNHRKKRGKEEEADSGATRATGSSSRKEKKSTKKRRSPKVKGSQRPGSSRKHADDDYFSCSTSPSSSGSRNSVEESWDDGGRGTRRRSEGRQPSVSSRGSAVVDGASGRSRRRAKTALERLNDLTDEDGGVSGDILSGGSGGGGGGNERSIRKGSSRRHRGHDSREAHDDYLYYSNKDRHSAGGDSSRRSSRNKRRDSSPSHEGHRDRNERDDGVRYAERYPSSHARRRHGSSLLSREDVSPNGDDNVKHGRDSSDRRRSTGGRRSSHGSESRRSSTGTAGGGRSRRDTREWER